MVCVLCVAFSVHSWTIDDKLLQVLGRPIDLATRTKQVTIDGKQVLVSYRSRVSLSIVEGTGAETEHNRVAIMRPEEPAKQFTLQGRSEPVADPTNGDGMFDRFFFRLSELGAAPDVGEQVFRALGSARRHMSEAGTAARELVDPNPGIKPDGWTHRSWQLRGNPVNLNFQVSYSYEGYKNLDSSEEFSAPVRLGTIWRPEPKFYSEQFFPDEKPSPKKQSTFGGVTFPGTGTNPGVQFDFPTYGDGERYAPSTWGSFKSNISLGGYLQDVMEENGKEKTTAFLTTIGMDLGKASASIESLAPRGTDMNYLNFAVPEDPCEADFDAPPGLLWLPSEAGYQSMMTGVRYEFRHTFMASADLATVVQQQPRMRTMCMNMSLKEPAQNVMYFPYRPSDPMLRELGRLMDASMFRGPWDQARTWIYTDHASFEDVNKRMSPPLSAGQYAASLADVGKLGGLTDADLKNPGMFRPDMLAGASAPIAALRWVVSVLEEHHAAAIVAYFGSGAPELKSLARGGAAKYETDTLAMSVQACTDSQKPEIRIAALKWLVANASGISVLKGRVGDLRESHYSGDAAETALARAVIDAGLASMPKDVGQFYAVHD